MQEIPIPRTGEDLYRLRMEVLARGGAGLTQKEFAAAVPMSVSWYRRLESRPRIRRLTARGFRDTAREILEGWAASRWHGVR